MTQTAPPSLLQENPLWQFSLVFYRHNDVKTFLLHCQDRRGADVCMMLWASYAAVCGRQLSDELWRVVDRSLLPRRSMIHSLRHLRRLLGYLCPRVLGVYEMCKRYELKLDRLQLAMLWTNCAGDWSGDRPALELAAQQYGLLEKEQARWASLLESYLASSEGLGTG
ncbi:TIGR02444 family protein [Microbulbifer sp. 2205BS26-8]|uniref:TIGR02444 family protein n=1 Tax=Microbulbifer sp. 2205BS26-8 TaxID=3064386 RepID=UPI00273D99AB|nr:TIGR02444 family protein [Microbulbifer sp. 2205BS26-8]MDP5210140.1 TIGR02444 family protein [Microbulbifer sp. 2205BS26-8]